MVSQRKTCHRVLNLQFNFYIQQVWKRQKWSLIWKKKQNNQLMNKNHSFSQWVLLKEELEASLSACVDITDRFLACPRGHVQDPGRSWTSVASGREGVASQHRRANKRLQTSSGVPAEIVSELPLHTAAITLPRSVFTSTQPFNQQRDWPERSLASNPSGLVIGWTAVLNALLWLEQTHEPKRGSLLVQSCDLNCRQSN